MELPDELVLPGARLRALREDDWLLDHALSRVADVPQWTYYPAEVDEQEARERVGRNLTQRAEGRGGRFVVERSGEALGTIGLRTARRRARTSTTRSSRRAADSGWPTEAVRALTRWALEHGADVVIARTMVGNTASERVLERASFRRGPLEVEPDGVSVIRWSLRAGLTTYSRVTYAPVGYDRGMTTVGPSRPTAAPRDVAIPDEPLTAALDRAAQRWPDRTAVDFLGAPTTYARAGRGGRTRGTGAARPRRQARRPGRARDAELHRARHRLLRRAAHRRRRRRAQPDLHRRRARAPARRLRCRRRARLGEGRPARAGVAAPDGLEAVVAVDLSADLSRGKRLALRLPVPSARTRAGGDVREGAARLPDVAPAGRQGSAAGPGAPGAVGLRRRAPAVHRRDDRHAQGRDAHAPQPRRERRAGPRVDRGAAGHRGRLRRPALLPRLRPDAVPELRDPRRRHARRVPVLRPRARARRAATPPGNVPAGGPAHARPPRGRRREAGADLDVVPVRHLRGDGAARRDRREVGAGDRRPA